MIGKREFIYYHLIKYSDHGAIDQAVDRLCSAPVVALSDVSLRVQLDCLVQTSQVVGVYTIPEIAQRCMEVRVAVGRKGDKGVPSILLGRALEAVGVAFATDNFRKKYKPYMENRLYKTQGLNYLLNHHGEQVLTDMATDISRFEEMFTERAQKLQGVLRGLMALKRTHTEVYKIFTKRRKYQECMAVRSFRRLKTVSLCLDDTELEDDSTAPSKFLPGQRAFSLDVSAGLEVSLPELAA